MRLLLWLLLWLLLLLLLELCELWWRVGCVRRCVGRRCSLGKRRWKIISQRIGDGERRLGSVRACMLRCRRWRIVRIRRHRWKLVLLIPEMGWHALWIGIVLARRRHVMLRTNCSIRRLGWWRRRGPSLLLFLDRRARTKLPGPSFPVSLSMHKQVAITIKIVPYTGRPAFCFALEAEIRVFELESSIDLLQGHWSG